MQKKEGADKPLSPEVTKLIEKLGKDPKSRLFVPLAEEYIKAGMLDEARMVLTDGLKVHQKFHAARVMLGRVLIEKGQNAEAKAELEQVIQASPDNLLAQRKLAGIYKDEGDSERARAACQAVLALSPKDPEMKSIIEELDRAAEEARKKTHALGTISTVDPSAEVTVEQTSYELPGPETEEGAGSERVSEEVTAEIPGMDEPEPVVVELEVPTGSLEEILKEAVGEPAAEPVSDPAVPEEVSGTETAKTAEVAPAAVSPMLDSALPEAEKSAEPAQEFVLDAPAEAVDATPKEEAVPDSPPPEVEKPTEAIPSEEITSESLADLYIKQGHFEKGIAVYRRLLAKDPTDQALFKKIDETLEQARLLKEGPKIQKHPEPISRPPAAAASVASPGSSKQPVDKASPSTDREQQRSQKIQRLEAWLNTIKKGDGK